MGKLASYRCPALFRSKEGCPSGTDMAEENLTSVSPVEMAESIEGEETERESLKTRDDTQSWAWDEPPNTFCAFRVERVDL